VGESGKSLEMCQDLLLSGEWRNIIILFKDYQASPAHEGSLKMKKLQWIEALASDSGRVILFF
jgi:hypothetical protein